MDRKMPRWLNLAACALGIVLACLLVSAAQSPEKPAPPASGERPAAERPPEPQHNPPSAPSPDVPPAPSVQYPVRRVGALIRDLDWESLPSAVPSKNRVKHGFASSLSYGIAPAAMVSEYDGLHAQVHIESGLPVICLCHVFSLPGEPAIVKLHPDPKKKFRELHAGNLHLGAKVEEAEKSDLVPVHIDHPEDTVWLIRPAEKLPPGEYALMLGTQNLSIFPFTVVPENPSAAPAKPH
jgi:hypothetical protein